MKKFAFFTLLSICVTAIAITSGNSQSKSISSTEFATNIADTTPKAHHMMKKDTSMHKTMVKKTKTKKPVKDSTQKK
ncbi:MAG TPA: hypothetical protein VGI61_02180 [Parafilimonas sp.]|jgi:hypothetical protein